MDIVKNKVYACIDLKSFYASVECVERGLDPLFTNLVVADPEKTEKTICLAVTPPLKAYGISGRSRLFEVVSKIKEVNQFRRKNVRGGRLCGESYDAKILDSSPEIAVSYIVAPPRMAHYMKYSTRIYNIYLRYIAPEDIHVYSIDEVFIDLTSYLCLYKCSPRELVMKMIRDVFSETGITATAGIGPNLYLCKIAMDIVAKKEKPDKNGVRIAVLDEMSYRKQLWDHRPLTDFWRVGRGYASRLEANGIYTMGDIARCSVGKPDSYYNEELLYKLFGVNAELLIDHAWGWEPCTISEIKSYKPTFNSISSGQVLSKPYSYEKAALIVKEMTELMSLDLVSKGLLTNQLTLTVGYDVENLTNPVISKLYKGDVTTDVYGRRIPKHAHGTSNLVFYTSSSRIITDAMMKLYGRIVNRDLLVRRVTITANRVIGESSSEFSGKAFQLDMFTDYEKEELSLVRERSKQRAMISIRKKYGNNAILKGMNLEEGGTTIERNAQIGGHKA